MRYSRLTLAAAILVNTAIASEALVYVGTYTNDKSKGIYAFRLKDGTLEPLGLVAELKNPSFVAIHPNKKFLYAVTEQETGMVAAFRIDPVTAKLTPLNQSSSKGDGPCHLVVDKTGRNVLVANYGGGSIASIPIKADGSLGPATASIQHRGNSVNPRRQEKPHAHSVNLSADNKILVVADLGLDQVLLYKFDAAKGTLAPANPPFTKVAAGSGPRHFAFHPSGKYAFVINELASTITAFQYGKAGTLTEYQTISTLPDGYKGDTSTAEIVVHPSGRFVYGSNRGHNSIALFRVGPDGRLTAAGHTPTGGQIPRNFAIDPEGKILIAGNQNSDSMVSFRINQATGDLTPAGQTFEVGAPVCFRYMTLK